MKIEHPKYAWVVVGDDEVATVVLFARSREQAELLWGAADRTGPQGELQLWEIADIGFVGVNRPDVKELNDQKRP